MNEREYKKILKDRLIDYRNNLDLSKDITFGIEIEYENIVKDTVSHLLLEEKYFNNELNGWINKSEIDIMEYDKYGEELNGEVSSPLLTDDISTWRNLKKVLKLLKDNGGIVTDKCGGHVNFGMHILGDNNYYWRNFFLLWILYEKEILKFSTGEFSNIRKNLNLKDKIICKNLSICNVQNIEDEEYLLNIRNVIFDECSDIYLHPLLPLNKQKVGNRIEFRVPNGTLNEEIWQNYINFFAKFIIASKKELDIEKVIYKIINEESNIIELADYIFDNDIDKEYFLIQALKTNKIYKKELLKHKSYTRLI